MKLLSMWPGFLQDIVEFQEIAKAEQPEFDAAESVIDSAHNEFSLFTMSEYGTRRWEKIMCIVPNPGDTLETRSGRVIARYLSALPYTYRSMLRYLDNVSGGDFRVDLDAANYELFVSVRLSGYDQQTALLAALTDMLPANILLKLQSKIQQTVADAKIIPTAAVMTIGRTLWRPKIKGDDK